MRNSYTSFKKADGLDTKGWDINFRQLFAPGKGIHPYTFLPDKFYESNDQKYACLVYTIAEWAVTSYSGLLAVFENKQQPALIVNPKNQWFPYQGERTLYFINDFLFLRKEEYDQNRGLPATPFIVIALRERKFGFINFDVSSVFYSPEYVKGSIYKFNLDLRNEMVNSRFANRDGEEFDITGIRFYDVRKLKHAKNIYNRERAKAMSDR